MATSGSYNFSITAAELIKLALENIGVLRINQTIPNSYQEMALRRLNYLVKLIQGNSDLMPGLKIFSRQRVTLFLAEGQQKYSIGPASTDARATTAYGRTTIDAAEAIGQTTISVTATTDTTTDPGTTVTMTAADIIGVEQNDGTIFWSTISSVAAGDTVTIASGLDVAAAVGNYVWWFTSRAQRFPVIENAVLRDENRNDSALVIYRENEAYDVGVADKYADGEPTSILVEPLRIATRVTLDTQPTDVTKQIVMTVLYPAEDYDASTDDIAFPQEYFLWLAWELGRQCVVPFGRPWTNDMEMNYQMAKSTAGHLNPEMSDLYFQCS